MKHSFLFILRIALFIVTYVIMTQPASAANTTATGFDPSSLPGTVVYVEGKEFAYFVAPTNWTNCNVWAWSNTTGTNYTQSGVWPGDPITFVGNTTDGSPVFQWIGRNIVENDRPTGIIFNNGSTQTADLVYVAGGVYNLNGNLLYTVSGSSTVVNGLAYQINSDGVSVTLVYDDSYKTINDAITIPKNVTIDGQPYTVTAIGNGAFFDCTGLTAVTIPNSVKTIGNGAFSGCSGLTTMAIPNSVTSIGGNAFYNCTGLTSVTIPNSVTTIGGNAFEYCTSLTSVNIPSSVTKISEHTFYYCYRLTSITIPSSVTSIGDHAFYYCFGLTSVTIPNSVTNIGIYAFGSCSGLTSLSIPGSVRTIYSSSFMDCSGLTSINVDSSNSFYDSRDNCNAIIKTSNNTLILGCKNTIIPNSVTSIGDYAFYDCWRLSSITIPNSVTSIGYYTFAYCGSLTSINSQIENPSIIDMGNNVFSGVSSNNNCILYVPSGTLNLYKATDQWKDFANIIDDAIIVNKLLYHLNDDNLSVTVEKCLSSGDIVIPNSINYGGKNYSVTSIGDEAFTNTGIASVSIPNSVTSIGYAAFAGCTGLTSVNIPNSVTSIDDYAFNYCPSLTSVTIPNSVTVIGEGAFTSCSGLTSIIVEAGNTKYDSRNNCNAIIEKATNTLLYGCQNSIIPNSVTSIGNSAFASCTGLTSISIPSSVTTIGNSAFNYCTGLTTMTIPNSVTSIGNYAFNYCSGLTSIIVEAGNTKYDSRNNCNAIIEKATNTLLYGCQNSIIPNSVTSIGNAAFSSCSGLTSITIPNSVTTIGGYAFYECTGLTTMTIPNSVTSIGDWAFYNCTGLTSVTIGKSVTSIGSYAFSFWNSPSLTSIKSKILNPENVSMGEYVFSGIDTNNCKLYVPKGRTGTYQNTPQWSDFVNVEEVPFTPGDVNYDDVCTASDVTALYNFILYNDESAIVIGDQNGDGSITASDVTAVYNIILGL